MTTSCNNDNDDVSNESLLFCYRVRLGVPLAAERKEAREADEQRSRERNYARHKVT